MPIPHNFRKLKKREIFPTCSTRHALIKSSITRKATQPDRGTSMKTLQITSYIMVKKQTVSL
jgi:hypothetical protein